MFHVGSLWSIGNETPAVSTAKQSTLSIGIGIGIKVLIVIFRGIFGHSGN